MPCRRDLLIAGFCFLALWGIFAGLGLFIGAPEALRTAPRVAAVDGGMGTAEEAAPATGAKTLGATAARAVLSPAGPVTVAQNVERPVVRNAPRPPLPPAARVLGTVAATPALSPADRRGLRCLALNIYFEARNEPLSGQIAVAHVVLNRVADRAFPDTICDVVRQGGDRRRYRCQFSWWCDGRSDRPREEAAWRHSLQLAYAIHHGQLADPTRGAKWYHAVYVNPGWREAFRQGPRIGRHIFYQRTS